MPGGKHGRSANRRRPKSTCLVWTVRVAGRFESLYLYGSQGCAHLFASVYALPASLSACAFQALLAWDGAVLVIVDSVGTSAGFSLANPGAEFRISEIDAPLRAFMAGDLRPVLQNLLRLAGMFGLAGDPLWRQNVAGRPVFDPLLGLFFYGGLLLALCDSKMHGMPFS